ncbi:MAG: right-handed parallel beta-helix repeat-containing protein [Thermoanaerobaculia bacterium]
MTFENVASVGNDGNGIAFNPGGDQTDFVVSSCNLSNNHGGTGFRVPTTASVDGLSITDSTMNGNFAIGMSMYGSVTDLFISGSVFNDNNLVGIYGNIHRCFATKKSAVIDGTTTNGNGRGIAFRIYGGSLTITNSTASNNNRANSDDEGQGLDLSVRDADATIVLSSVTAENNEDVNIFLETKSGGSLTSASFAAFEDVPAHRGQQPSPALPESHAGSSRLCEVRSWRRQGGPGSRFDVVVPGQSSEFGGAYRFERPIDACELAPGRENTPQHRVSLESNERNFLSLRLARLLNLAHSPAGQVR